MMDFSKAGKNGVPLMRVMPDSAAKKAGLRNGDIVMSVNQMPIVGAIELRNLLQRLVPGSETTILYRRNGDEKVATVKLGSRADNAGIKRVPRKRMERMQRMGTSINRVRSNFPNVVQSDIPINPEDTGAPVLDLDGKLVGITIARSSRIKTFITPAETLLRVLASDPNPVTHVDKNRLQSNLLEEANKSSNSGEGPAARIRRLLGDFDK
jgi:S1-C subfamily serine protease